MPLKPIFTKAPLKTSLALPLYPGQATVNDTDLRTLLDLALQTEYAQYPLLWQGLYRAAMLLKDEHADAITEMILNALAEQDESGRIGVDVIDALQIMRAGLAVFEHTADKEILARIIQWCGYLAANWDTVIAVSQLRCHPADLMELLEAAYRASGKKGLLTLMEKLRAAAMDWSGVLNTFAVQRGMAHVTPWKDLEAGLLAEEGNEQGFYTRQSLICHGESLADGVRSSVLNGMFSGNGQELAAARKGFERIKRFHGAACGGITSDEMIAGTSPAAGVDAGSTGAWLEALSVTACADQDGWAFDEIAVLLNNAFARHLAEGKLHDLIRVNALKTDTGDTGAYHLSAPAVRPRRAMARLLRGAAAAYSHAVCTAADGIAVKLLVNGSYTVLVDGTPVTLKVETAAGKAAMTLSMKKTVSFVLHIRVPGYAAQPAVRVNDRPALQASAGADNRISGEWQNGDTITLNFAEKLVQTDGHHQGISVMKGATLYVLPADDAWSAAACGDAVVTEDDRVMLPVAPVEGWRVKADIPADLPVLPAARGETVLRELKPYRENCGIALIPKAGRV